MAKLARQGKFTHSRTTIHGHTSYAVFVPTHDVMRCVPCILLLLALGGVGWPKRALAAIVLSDELKQDSTFGAGLSGCWPGGPPGDCQHGVHSHCRFNCVFGHVQGTLCWPLKASSAPVVMERPGSLYGTSLVSACPGGYPVTGGCCDRRANVPPHWFLMFLNSKQGQSSTCTCLPWSSALHTGCLPQGPSPSADSVRGRAQYIYT